MYMPWKHFALLPAGSGYWWHTTSFEREKEGYKGTNEPGSHSSNSVTGVWSLCNVAVKGDFLDYLVQSE